MDHFKIGVGKSDITDSRKGLQMQGMSDPAQRTTGVLHELYARAFVIEGAKNTIAIVIAEIWSCTKLLKAEVLRALEREDIQVFTNENLLIAGTHTHSAPGGYAGYVLFDQPSGKVDPVTLKTMVDGIAKAIKIAIKSQGPGKIYFHQGILENCGGQRSLPAYENNPRTERERYQSATDKEMLQLKFVHLCENEEVPVGLLNWYAIHPTDLGQFNMLVSGDNKGIASIKMEQYAAESFGAPDFVAAFANSNCGDVSGNVAFGLPDGVHDEVHANLHGELQFQRAKGLFVSAEEEVSGNLKYWYKEVDMSNVGIAKTNNQTYPYALGLSLTAASSEDSIPRYQHPITGKIKRVARGIREGLTVREVGINAVGWQWLVMSLLASLKFKTTLPLLLSKKIKRGHHPKPIVVAPQQNERLVPHHLPLQVLKIGNIAILGIPGEITTMAGRRLRERIKQAFDHANQQINYVILSTYANDYAQYITTKEEYDMQHYEGASTPFGPHTLDAYAQAYEQLIAEN